MSLSVNAVSDHTSTAASVFNLFQALIGNRYQDQKANFVENIAIDSLKYEKKKIWMEQIKAKEAHNLAKDKYAEDLHTKKESKTLVWSFQDQSLLFIKKTFS